MSQLVHNFNFLNEVLHCLLRQVSLSESLNSYFGSKPFALVDISVASTTNEVVLNVKADFLELDEKVKAAGFKALYQSKLVKVFIFIIPTFIVCISSLVLVRVASSLLLFKVSHRLLLVGS